MEKRSSQNLPFEHVVVLMLENRSFDNLLGFLYEDDLPNGLSYAGLQENIFNIPVPERVDDFKSNRTISPFEAKNFSVPFPDPGEKYRHVNTQLYNFINSENLNVNASNMVPPYNLPDPIPNVPSMDGFINDYVNVLQAMGNSDRTPDSSMYSVIMQCFKPKQLSTLSSLAKEFAVFDHWFSAVPSQTWCNRAFWHAAASGGMVNNPSNIRGAGRWIKNVWTKKTFFNLLNEKNISYMIYTLNPIALTNLIHGFSSLRGNHVSTSNTLDMFIDDINNEKLPQYSFIEPRFIGQHNDQHPPSVDSILFGKTRTGTVLLGEKLIYDIYNAIRSSDKYSSNTLLIITHDEHGGCFDHVPPPSAIPPTTNIEGEDGFKFNRLGVRVPMVMVSSHIKQNTIINDVFDHTSFIKTMSDKWELDHLTDRDKNASSFAHVFSEAQRELPIIDKPKGMLNENESEYYNDPMNSLQESMLIMAKCIMERNTKSAQVVDVKCVGDCINYFENIKNLLSIFGESA